jgi:trk system potassium uptake protein TrkH
MSSIAPRCASGDRRSIALMISDKLSLLPALFEVTLAFGTVGLLLISIVMFLGRVGTVTLIVALAGRTKRRRCTYPQEDIPIG